MRKLQIKVYRSYEKADKDMLRDSLLMTPEERVAAVNVIRRKVFGLKGIVANNRVNRIISYGKRSK